MAKLVSFKLERWMTPRDRQIIVAVYHHGILNSRQVEDFFFKDANNSRIIALRRLKKLVDNNFLKQHWYGYNKQGSMQHFTLTNKGAVIVSSELDIDHKLIKINDAGIIANIEHTSLINDFHIDLLNYDFNVLRYTVENHNLTKFIFNAKEYEFEPDAIVDCISPSGRRYPMFIEMDRGTMSYNYFKQKIPNYENYYASDYYLKNFNSFPLVVIITTDDTRLRRMKDIIEDNKKSDITYLITTIKMSKDMEFHYVGTDKIIKLG